MKTITFYITMITFLLLAFSACNKYDTLSAILKHGQSGGLSEQGISFSMTDPRPLRKTENDLTLQTSNPTKETKRKFVIITITL